MGTETNLTTPHARRVLESIRRHLERTEMGCHASITAERFPKQGSFLGRRVNVFFHYDDSRQLPGVVVRDDAEAPHVGIIRLEDGKCVLMSEAQYQIAD